MSLTLRGLYKDVNLENESSFSTQQRGGSFAFGFFVAENLTLSVGYTFKQEEILIGKDLKPSYDFDGDGVYNELSDVASGVRDQNGMDANAVRAALAAGVTILPTDVSPYILNTEGTSNTSSLNTSLTYSTLDFPNSPKNGMFAQVNLDLAGLGGDRYYAMTTASARAYREVYPDIVALGRVQGGFITSLDGNDVAINDSFFRGPDVVRGFAASGIGPRAQRTLPGADGVLFTGDDDVKYTDALGGTAYWGASAELRFPIYGIPRSFGFTGAVFADAGSLFNVGDLGNLPTTNTDTSGNKSAVSWSVMDDASVRASPGFSVIWKSPFGPLRADIAWPLAKQEYDKTQLFRFSGATRF